MNQLVIVLLYVLLAPLLGGLLAGLDRKITARMQGRFGPPILQPFYDVLKLVQKEERRVNNLQNFYIYNFLFFIVFTGALFFLGDDMLLVIFALTLASIFLVLAAYATNSPFSNIGAERELIQMMAYEPMMLMMAMGMYLSTGSFIIREIADFGRPLMIYLPGIFVGYLFILTIKFRKSPFDLSMSHHAHQEIVKGLTTEFTGKTLAAIEVAHWYENVYLLGFVYLFFANSPAVGVIVALAAYFAEILIDNCSARFKWQFAMKSTWVVTILVGLTNILVIYLA
ncbi:MAG: NADH-quinone oxidoreductase subunit H [Pseudomonadota bacterium]